MECYMEKKPGNSSACNIYISKGSFLQGFLKLDTKKSLLVRSKKCCSTVTNALKEIEFESLDVKRLQLRKFKRNKSIRYPVKS